MSQSETSLKSYLRTKYGEQTQKTVATLGKELLREARFSNHHHFTLRCYKSGIVPPSLRIKAPVNTERARSAAARTARIFVQERIKTSWRAKKAAVSIADECRKSLEATLLDENFQKVTSLCERTAARVFLKCKERQVRKFDTLREKIAKKDEEVNLRPTWLINLSKRDLTNVEQKVLSKGPQFAMVPKIDPVDIAAPIEAALQFSSASPQTVESARIRVCEAITRAKRPMKNVTKEERKAMKDLREDKNIRILQADKGNATVVLDAMDYDSKVHDLIDDTKSYRILKKDPTRATERKLLTLLRDLRRRDGITEAFYNSVRPSEGSSKPARFYGRVKLHKESAPLRPVVATCETSTYALARRLSGLLRPLVGSSGRILRNTNDLVDTMKDISLDANEMLVSYDVKSLFTSIPVEESIGIIERKLRDDETLNDRTTMDVSTIIRLLRFCLTNTSFQYNGIHYQQLDGVAMGSPVSPVIADIFMEDLETKAFAAYAAPRLWKRFVDDVIAVLMKKSGETLLQHLNNQHPKIKFTMEAEKSGCLPFMDVCFTRQLDGSLTRDVYQKPTHTNRYVLFNSHHPENVKAGIVQGLADRAIKVCSDTETRDGEFRRISAAMECNGYPKRFTEKAISKRLKRGTTSRAERLAKEADQAKLEKASIPYVEGLSQEIRRIVRAAGVRCSFYTPDTMRNLYQAKDVLPQELSTHVVYSVNCKTCDAEYVGETQRALRVREKEHRDAIRLGHCSKSAVAEHVHDCETPHEVDWNSLQVVDRARRRTERKVREAFHIYKRQPAMNRDAGIERSAVWNAIL